LRREANAGILRTLGEGSTANGRWLVRRVARAGVSRLFGRDSAINYRVPLASTAQNLNSLPQLEGEPMDLISFICRKAFRTYSTAVHSTGVLSRSRCTVHEPETDALFSPRAHLRGRCPCDTNNATRLVARSLSTSRSARSARVLPLRSELGGI
jgi:hypothetical protein